MAQVLLTRHIASLPTEAVVLAGGGAGNVSVPFAIEPGACYAAVMTLLQGAPHTVGVRVQIGARTAVDMHGSDPPGALVAFCADEQFRALAQVEARGASPLGWGLAVYRLESGIWETTR
jgi:hypothetical protein